MNTIRWFIVIVMVVAGLLSGGLLYMENQAEAYGIGMGSTPLANTSLYNNTDSLVVQMRETVRDTDPDEPGGAEFAYVLATGALNALRLFFDFGGFLIDDLIEPMMASTGITVPTWASLSIRGAIDGFILTTLIYAIFFRND